MHQYYFFPYKRGFYKLHLEQLPHLKVYSIKQDMINALCCFKPLSVEEIITRKAFEMSDKDY